MKRFFALLVFVAVLAAPFLNAKEITLPDYPSQGAVPYHYVTLKRGDTLQKLFGERWEAVARFNRIDPRLLKIRMRLKVPNDLEAAQGYTPMPIVYEKALAQKQYVLIDIREQFLGAYEHGALVFSAPISSANPECLDEKFRKKTCYTPLGKFRVLALHKDHASSIYRGAESGANIPMPYAVMFTIEEAGGRKVSYWIHGGNLPGWPASHGCIRLMPVDAKRFFLWLGGNPEKKDIVWIKNGAPVEIVGEPFSYARQGEVVLEKLPPDLPLPETAFIEKTLSGTSTKIQQVASFQKNRVGYLIAPIPIDRIPGKYEIVAYAAGGAVLYRKTMLIDRGVFPVSKSLVWNQGRLTKEQLQRIAREKEEMARAYKSGAKEPLWSAGFSMPIAADKRAGKITHPFGEIRLNPKNRRSRHHLGADIQAPEGHPIQAIADGRVAHVGRNYLLEGNITIIDHGAGIYSLYLHQSEVLVRAGETVAKGQVIGKVGQTGNARGPHLHLAAKVNGTWVDPIKLIAILNSAASS